MPTPGTFKRRELRFSTLPENQTQRALILLRGLDGLRVERIEGRRALSVSYDIFDYTLEGLEEALMQQGFHLDNSLFSKLMRALIRYCEQTQLHTLRSPQRLIKKSNEVYVKAWEHHLHGDHDDTPPELREYK
ncbi:MAG: hypothetical protein IPH26_00780 [Sterolibacteriaceae bacterium]|uniref:Uncharacterized protein n=1 Tax=Candidatus Methylophosphatis roskildensis TaxID=2899263 RepID=A0A9D7E0U5_9PROT|nr:hypothetical protein [Candidatus Methylophosphatis roskildensis]MBK7234383.1 hypothetical protein [Sterolibacteriaceae bacterium]